MARNAANVAFNIDKQPPSKWRSALSRVVAFFVIALNIIACVGLIISGAAQGIAPSMWRHSTLVMMTFPAWLLAAFVMLVVDLIWYRRVSLMPIAAMLVCYSPIHDFFPLNIHFGMSQKEKDSSFTLMTYNVFAFNNYQNAPVEQNEQLAFILKRRPDVVCIQEARFLAPTASNKITQSQLDSLHLIYPYVLTQGNDFALLSKFQASPINLDFPVEEFKSGDMAAWRLKIYGKVVNLFSVHLRSLYLTGEDRETYQDLVKLDSVSSKELREAKSVLAKVSDAALEREEQAKYLQKYLGKYGGKNAIVCGDFNDPVGCYALHLLTKECHMRQAYADAGFGPAITYNASDLYFRIDHILYRGAMKPYSAKTGSIKASDHYPLIATFIVE